MNLNEIYNSNLNSIIGSDNSYLSELQKKLIENYDLDQKILNSNESTKHFDRNILNSLKYYMDNSNPEIYYKNKEDNDESFIEINNGKFYTLNNFEKNKILFTLLNNKKDLLSKKIKAYSNTFLEDYIVNLNSVLLNSSFDLILNEKEKSKLNINHNIIDKNTTIYSKNFFTINPKSELILIERINNNVKSNLNIVNYFELKPGSKVIHLVLQSNSQEANLQFSTHVNSYASSEFRQLIFNISSSSIRNHHYADLIGQNAFVDFKGVFFASRNQIIDNKTHINHIKPNCNSNQTYKAILTEKSNASYLSKTFVDKKAQKTEAYQLSKGILLSSDAFFHSKPELKIFADDVKCSHGSTIGPFDEDILFYLRTRGLNEIQAKSFLIKSFYSDVLSNIEEVNYKKEVNDLINNWLKINSF